VTNKSFIHSPLLSTRVYFNKTLYILHSRHTASFSSEAIQRDTSTNSAMITHTRDSTWTEQRCPSSISKTRQSPVKIDFQLAIVKNTRGSRTDRRLWWVGETRRFLYLISGLGEYGNSVTTYKYCCHWHSIYLLTYWLKLISKLSLSCPRRHVISRWLGGWR